MEVKVKRERNMKVQIKKKKVRGGVKKDWGCLGKEREEKKEKFGKKVQWGKELRTRKKKKRGKHKKEETLQKKR